MKVRQTLFSINNPSRHDEWLLMRDGDDTSLPPANFMIHMRDSLAEFNVDLQPIPSPTLAPTRKTGMYPGQNLFKINGYNGNRSGLLSARQTYVESINNIFAATPIAINRQSICCSIP